MIYQVVSSDFILQQMLILGISMLGGFAGMLLIAIKSAKDTFGDEEENVEP